MGKNFDLDKLKSSWKEQNSFQINDSEIKNAINKKSINIVKYIFWISIIEFILIFGSNFIFNETPEVVFLSEEKLKDFNFWNEIMNEIYWFNTLLSLIFVVIFYLKYKKISQSNAILENISRIINFRNTIHLYVIFNLLIALIYVFTIGEFLFADQLFSKGIIKENNLNRFMILTIVSLIIIGITFLYYKLIFGIFLKKLNKNIKELKSIE